jgi:hypothetical protein
VVVRSLKRVTGEREAKWKERERCELDLNEKLRGGKLNKGPNLSPTLEIILSCPLVRQYFIRMPRHQSHMFTHKFNVSDIGIRGGGALLR